MADGKILVAGSLHFDIVIDAPHLPALDETVMGGPASFVMGGKGRNQAVAAAQYGAAVSMAGCVGNDWFGERLTADLDEAGIDMSLLQRSAGRKSGMSVAIRDKRGDYGAVVASGANLDFDPDAFDIPEDICILLLQNEISEAANIAVARKAAAGGAAIFVNAAPYRNLPDEFVELVDVLVLNRIEAAAWFGSQAAQPGEVVELAEKRDSGPNILIVTLGSDGLVLHQTGHPAKHLAGFEVETVSTHGAGDVFVGAFAARRASGVPLLEALTYAQAAAALFVSRVGPASRHSDPAEIETLVQERMDAIGRR